MKPMKPMKPMKKFRHPRDRQVAVDHGLECRHFWLDGGELEAIQTESLPVFVTTVFVTTVFVTTVFVTNMVRYFSDLLREESVERSRRARRRRIVPWSARHRTDSPSTVSSGSTDQQSSFSKQNNVFSKTDLPPSVVLRGGVWVGGGSRFRWVLCSNKAYPGREPRVYRSYV